MTTTLCRGHIEGVLLLLRHRLDRKAPSTWCFIHLRLNTRTMSAPANPFTGRLLPAPRGGGYQDSDYWIWCGSAAQDADGTY